MNEEQLKKREELAKKKFPIDDTRSASTAAGNRRVQTAYKVGYRDGFDAAMKELNEMGISSFKITFTSKEDDGKTKVFL